MKYSELIKFDPIESVIQLTNSNDSNIARSLVKSYVMSEKMADNINSTMLSQLKLVDSVDSKGVILVGNYGTGKSHLMSVISAIAIDSDNLQYVHNDNFAKYAEVIAGKFETIRIELGAVTTPLREIILSNIQADFKARGLQYNYPEMSGITNNKDTLLEMMQIFGEKYQDKGYLIVVDEVLDFLRSKDERSIRLDLGFMRELGEVVKSSRLRIVFGFQERLFNNPNFQFVAQRINQMRDRYEQTIIRKEDTAYVVSERILKKTDQQKAIIRSHLERFCNLYLNMSERMEEFVSLYPIHPSFIDVFNRIYIAENRHILANISTIVKGILSNDFNESEPGIISFDSYWAFIRNNMSYRSDPNINEVVEKSGQLEAIIERSFKKKQYMAIAMKVINALSVHRLTTGDIQIRVGLTSENLRDDVCLYISDMPDQSSDTLQTLIQVVVKEIITTVSGQFIDYNKDNDQYFLDLKKDVDYDEKITQRAAIIPEDSLNSHFFDVVNACLDWDIKEYVPGFRIYEYTLNWFSHHIFRRGYLFCGKPEDRSTAQPPEDYYIYFLPPYGNTEYTDEMKRDEVFFIFKDDEGFKNNLRLYAAAILQRGQADERNKAAYQAKADGFRKKLTAFLSEQKNTCFDVLYYGVKKQPIEVMKGNYKADRPFKETIDLVASILFDGWFNERYPDFPIFKTQITIKNQASAIKAAFDNIAGRKEQLGTLMLDSFGLLSGETITIANSKYAGYYASQLEKLAAGSVLNFNDIYEEEYSNIDKFDKKFKLSYTMLPIVFLALVYIGRAVITLRDGTVLTASNLETIPRIGTTDIYEFKHISKPKGLRLAELMRLFEVLGLQEGLIRDENSRVRGLEVLLAKSRDITQSAAKAQSRLSGDFSLWGEPLIASHIAVRHKEATKRAIDTFGNFHTRFNTVPKLNNFTYTIDEVEKLSHDVAAVMNVLEYDAFRAECIDNVNYMMNIESTDSIKQQIESAKSIFRRSRDDIADGKYGETAAKEVLAELEKVKSEYIDVYYKEHQKCRLDVNSSKHKSDLISSAKYANLKRLAEIDILPDTKLTAISNDLAALKTCIELTPEMLKTSHLCPKCGFLLNGDDPLVKGAVENIEGRLDALIEEWSKSLLNAVSDPLALEQKPFLSEEQQKVIDLMLSNKALPEKVDGFFVGTITALLEGFEAVTINGSDLIDRLTALGPCDSDTFKKQIDEFITSATKGKEKSKLRIIVR